MISIVNADTLVRIDFQQESHDDFIKLKPMWWQDDDPYFEIELKDFGWVSHVPKCSDCSSFWNDLGTPVYNWFIHYAGHPYLIDMQRSVGQGFHQNQIISGSVGYFTGTRIKLHIDTDTSIELALLLKVNEILENYETCSILKHKKDGLDATAVE